MFHFYSFVIYDYFRWKFKFNSMRDSMEAFVIKRKYSSQDDKIKINCGK